MKKIALFVFSWCLLLMQTSQAQISFGGTPFTFGSDFKNSALAEKRLDPYLLPEVDMARVRREDREIARNRFAVATTVNITPKNAGLWQTLPTGDRLWRVLLQIQTSDINGLRLLFDKFRLPLGSKMFIYSTDGKELLGAFTHQNNHESGVFATTLIKGREFVIEYYEPFATQEKFEFELNRIDQAYKTPVMEKNKATKRSGGTKDFLDAAGCNLDINCTSLGNDWQEEKRGVVRIIVVDPQGSGFCSGTLINNTANDNKPYILTADHCGEASTTANFLQWSFDFNYEVTTCGTTTEPTIQSMTGCTLRAKSSASDFLLVEINQAIPANYNVYFNGWDRTSTLPTTSVCIQHPSGDVKKISRDTDVAVSSDIDGNTTTNGNFIKVSWNEGITEGGSSGSALFNNAGRIVGQLFGGGSFCYDTQSPDWYGKVSVSWAGGGTNATRLSNWLDPTNSGVTTLNGKEGATTLANFIYSPNSIAYQSSPVTFTDNSAGNITSRSWNFGSGASTATATTTGPHSITYSTLGAKTITLSVNGGASTATRGINVLPTFTPDYAPADGGNFDVNADHFMRVFKRGTNFQRGSSTVTGKDGTASGSFAWVTGLTGNYVAFSDAELYTPNYNFSTAGSYILQFKTKFKTELGYDGFIVEYSTNKGVTWTKLGTTTATNWYNSAVEGDATDSFSPNSAFFSGTTSGFETKIFNVSSLAGNADVSFRFIFRSDSGVNDAGVAIDDFQIFGPLKVMSFSPAHNATNVALDANLVATFNRNITKGTGNIVIKKVSDNSIVETINVTSTAVTVANAVVTINPVNNLPATTAVYVEIPNTAFKDANNISFTGFTGNNTWSFTTLTPPPPVLVTLSPANNATNVALDANLVITFDKNVKKGTGNIVIKKMSDNSVFETISVTNAQVSISNATVTIDPNSNLAGTTGYYVEVASGAILDLADVAYAGFTGNNTWNFTTETPVPPALVTLNPANNATGVNVGMDLTMTFSKNVKKGTGNIVIKKMTDNAVVETINVTNTQVSISNATVTINPTNNLAGLTGYYVEVANGAILDLVDIAYVGFTGNNTWNFTTAEVDITAPTVVTLSPANNSTNIAVNTNLSITFSENVKKGTTGNISIKKVSDNSVVETIAITNNVVSVAGTVVTINPVNDLAFFTDVYVEVDNNAIQDLSNNAFGGISGNSTWKFKTVNETTPPTIVTLSPANGAQSFPGANNLVMTFSENVKKGTAGNIVIRKVSDNTAVETIAIADAKIAVSGTTVTINPTNDLTFNTEFYVEVSAGAIQDLADNNFAGITGNTTWKFKTDFSTAIENNMVGKAITVYPNPTDRIATLLVREGVNFKNVEINVFDASGKVVWQTRLSQLAGKQTLDWNTLPTGNYFLEIKTEQGTTVKKVIKQRN
jgi:methionine-rich copper-binding protein CopC